MWNGGRFRSIRMTANLKCAIEVSILQNCNDVNFDVGLTEVITGKFIYERED